MTKTNLSEPRAVAETRRSTPTLEGAGVSLRRAFGGSDPRLDPFLLLDDFHSDDPEDYIAGFPWHPHRGIETITYMLEGSMAHGDSMGNRGVIGPGDVQWMTAGSGIIHEEMPRQREGTLWGFQLWANLPAAHKMMPPRYQEITAAEIPLATLAEGVEAHVICGRVAGVRGPVREIITDPLYLDVTVAGGAEAEVRLPREHNAFAYLVRGEGSVGRGSGRRVEAQQLVILGPGDGVQLKAATPGMRLLLVAGRPLGEPVAWRGPIVMNSEEELRVAFREYREGTFIKEHVAD